MNSPSLLLTQNLARLYRQTRGNPVAGLVPLSLTRAINNFEMGWLRDLALIYERLENGADLDIAAVGPKRRAAVSGLEWDIVIDDLATDEAEAQRHKQALAYCFNNLTVRNAVEPDEEGEVASLVENVMLAKFLRYSVHEILWQPQGRDLTAQLVYAPVSLFENTSGPLMYCGPSGGSGLFELDRDGWLVCKGRTLGMGLAIAWMFDSLSLGDWLEYNRNFALPGIHGETPHAQESKEFAAFVSAIDEMVARFRVVTGQGNKVNVIESSSTGGAAHEPLHNVMQRAKIVLCMDQDLSTLSQKNSNGASVQQDADYLRIKADARFVEDAINRRFVRRVIEQCFGTGVQPRAWFRLILPDSQNDQSKIARYEFLIRSGVPVGRDQLAETFGHSLPKAGAPLAQTQDFKTQDTRPEAQGPERPGTKNQEPGTGTPSPISHLPSPTAELSNAFWNAGQHPRAPAGGEGSGGGRFVPKQGPVPPKPPAPAHPSATVVIPRPAVHAPAPKPVAPPASHLAKPAVPAPGNHGVAHLPAGLHAAAPVTDGRFEHVINPKLPSPPSGEDMEKSLAPPPPLRVPSSTLPAPSHETGRSYSRNSGRDSREAFKAAVRSVGGRIPPAYHGRHGWDDGEPGRDSRLPSAGRLSAEGLKLRSFPQASPDLPRLVTWRGGEHLVTLDGERVIKRTKPNQYGYVVTEDVEPGHRGPLKRLLLRHATPSEYFHRHALISEGFGVHSGLHGVELRPRTWPTIVTSQPTIPGDSPPDDETGRALIARYMTHHGFEQVPDAAVLQKSIKGTVWHHPKKHLVVADARPANFKLHEGRLTPIDLIINRYGLTPGLKQPPGDDPGYDDDTDDDYLNRLVLQEYLRQGRHKHQPPGPQNP